MENLNTNILKNNLKCPFCNPDPSREIIAKSSLVYSIYDSFPVNKGHALIIPKRHCANYFELTREEQFACWSLLNEVKNMIEQKYIPDGFNVGININQAAGQTIPHVHIHLIPRYVGDVSNPRGGVRGVIPNKQNYLNF
jgi:diadenosine tetraphosphate (Ap4A) HIT family hydrolase